MYWNLPRRKVGVWEDYGEDSNEQCNLYITSTCFCNNQQKLLLNLTQNFHFWKWQTIPGINLIITKIENEKYEGNIFSHSETTLLLITKC